MNTPKPESREKMLRDLVRGHDDIVRRARDMKAGEADDLPPPGKTFQSLEPLLDPSLAGVPRGTRDGVSAGGAESHQTAKRIDELETKLDKMTMLLEALVDAKTEGAALTGDAGERTDLEIPESGREVQGEEAEPDSTSGDADSSGGASEQV